MADMREDHLNPDNEHLTSTDQEFEKALRPLRFEDFKGQDKIIENLKTNGIKWNIE